MIQNIYDIPLKSIDGKETNLSQYRGKTLLIVNVASKCGFTPQYEDLEKLYKNLQPQGLEILGFPTNDFLKQEPGSDKDIASFCSLTYGVTFPMFSKISVKGKEQHPLFKLMTTKKPIAINYVGRSPFKKILFRLLGGTSSEVQWNFEKFLVSTEGEVLERWASEVSPSDPRFIQRIKQSLSNVV